jgi:hypothetical protein
MYTAIRRYEGTDVNALREIIRRAQEELVPQLKQIPGFMAYYIVDAGEGTIASVSVFEDRDGVAMSTMVAENWVRENIGSLAPNPPQVTAGEVVLQAEREYGRINR